LPNVKPKDQNQSRARHAPTGYGGRLRLLANGVKKQQFAVANTTQKPIKKP
jgi:hypothetical protein